MGPLLEREPGEEAQQNLRREIDKRFEALKRVENTEMQLVIQAQTDIDRTLADAIVEQIKRPFILEKYVVDLTEEFRTFRESHQEFLKKLSEKADEEKKEPSSLWVFAKHSPWAATIMYLTYAAMKFNHLT